MCNNHANSHTIGVKRDPPACDPLTLMSIHSPPEGDDGLRRLAALVVEAALALLAFTRALRRQG